MAINPEDLYRYTITVPGIRPRLVAPLKSHFEELAKTYTYVKHKVRVQNAGGMPRGRKQICFSVDAPFDNRNDALQLRNDFFNYLAERRIGNMRFIVAENPRLLEGLMGYLTTRLNSSNIPFDLLRIRYIPVKIIAALRSGKRTGLVDTKLYSLKSQTYQPAIPLSQLASEVRRIHSTQADLSKIVEVQALYGIKEVAEAGPWVDGWGNYVLFSQSRLPHAERATGMPPTTGAPYDPPAPSKSDHATPQNPNGSPPTLALLLEAVLSVPQN
ncbi:MAG: hypothetical protein AABX75_03210 [Nanoarchaeota archaeon]